jgi:hypothetical protein
VVLGARRAGAIASGYEATAEAAVDATERSYRRWLKEH